MTERSVAAAARRIMRNSLYGLTGGASRPSDWLADLGGSYQEYLLKKAAAKDARSYQEYRLRCEAAGVEPSSESGYRIERAAARFQEIP